MTQKDKEDVRKAVGVFFQLLAYFVAGLVATYLVVGTMTSCEETPVYPEYQLTQINETLDGTIIYPAPTNNCADHEFRARVIPRDDYEYLQLFSSCSGSKFDGLIYDNRVYFEYPVQIGQNSTFPDTYYTFWNDGYCIKLTADWEGYGRYHSIWYDLIE